MKIKFRDYVYQSNAFVFKGFFSDIQVSCAIDIERGQKQIVLSASDDVFGLTEFYDEAIDSVIMHLLMNDVVEFETTIADLLLGWIKRSKPKLVDSVKAVLVDQFGITIKHGHTVANVMTNNGKTHLFYVS